MMGCLCSREPVHRQVLLPKLCSCLTFRAQEQRDATWKSTKERGKKVLFVFLHGRKIGRCASPADVAAVVDKHVAKQKLIDLGDPGIADPGGSSASSGAVSEQPEGAVLGRRKRAAGVDYDI